MLKSIVLLFSTILGFLSIAAFPSDANPDLKIQLKAGDRQLTLKPALQGKHQSKSTPTIQSNQAPQPQPRPQRKSMEPCPACGMG